MQRGQLSSPDPSRSSRSCPLGPATNGDEHRGEHGYHMAFMQFNQNSWWGRRLGVYQCLGGQGGGIQGP